MWIIVIMSSTSFSPDILLSPFLSLDQIITSLTYSAHFSDYQSWYSQNFSCFLVPKQAGIYPSSLLGSVYAYCMKNPHIRRVVYMRADDVHGIVWTEDTAIDYILGQSVFYDRDYYKHFPMESYDKDFYTTHVFWSAHVLYSRFLDNVSLVPIVLPTTLQDITIYKELISQLDDIMNDEDTLCILADDYTFWLSEEWEVSLERNHSIINRLFYDYCIQYGKTPHLIQSEAIDDDIYAKDNEDIYQWVFAI